MWLELKLQDLGRAMQSKHNLYIHLIYFAHSHAYFEAILFVIYSPGLESDLKVQLFERHARGLVLTENGEYLFKSAHEIISKLKDVESNLSGQKDKINGKLVVTTVVSFGTTWLTPRIQEFMQLNPDIEVELIF